MEGADTYSVAEAAKILKLTEGRVRQMLRAGELEGIPPEESGERGWRVYMRSVHDRERPARIERPSTPAETPEDLREYRQRIEDLQRELGRMEGRLEITEVAESTLREQLQRERDRADRLEAELAEARGRGFWRRLLGG
jgi:excisionase family DNA binding protein